MAKPLAEEVVLERALRGALVTLRINESITLKAEIKLKEINGGYDLDLKMLIQEKNDTEPQAYILTINEKIHETAKSLGLKMNFPVDLKIEMYQDDPVAREKIRTDGAALRRYMESVRTVDGYIQALQMIQGPDISRHQKSSLRRFNLELLTDEQIENIADMADEILVKCEDVLESRKIKKSSGK